MIESTIEKIRLEGNIKESDFTDWENLDCDFTESETENDSTE